MCYQGNDSYPLEFIVKSKMGDNYTDKDNNLDVFAHRFLTYTFGLSLPLLQHKLNGMLAAHGWNGGGKMNMEWAGDKMNVMEDEEYISLEKQAHIHLFAFNILCINL